MRARSCTIDCFSEAEYTTKVYKEDRVCELLGTLYVLIILTIGSEVYLISEFHTIGLWETVM